MDGPAQGEAPGRARTRSADLALLACLNSEAAIDSDRLKFQRGVLGTGAFATVRAAELRPPPGGNRSGGNGGDAAPRQVAVKTLHCRLHNAEEIELFMHEAELLRTLRHRNIASFLGCGWHRASLEDSARPAPGVEGGSAGAAHGAAALLAAAAATCKQSGSISFYYVQEFCSGGSLGDLVRRQMIRPYKPLYSDVDALRWSLQIARALQYLHELQPPVLHRDLKLDNVMLSCPQPSRAEAKLADFGLARMHQEAAVGKAPAAAALPTGTQGARQMDGSRHARRKPLDGPSAAWLTGKTGSLGYMAPEVLASRPYGASADVFSLAMVMHSLFARQIPGFELLHSGSTTEGDPMELWAAKVAEGYRPRLPPHLPAAVAAVIEACWKNDADLRPAARAVVEALERAQMSGDLDGSAADTPVPGCACTVM